MDLREQVQILLDEQYPYTGYVCDGPRQHTISHQLQNCPYCTGKLHKVKRNFAQQLRIFRGMSQFSFDNGYAYFIHLYKDVHCMTRCEKAVFDASDLLQKEIRKLVEELTSAK